RTTVCRMIESGTVYHFLLPTLTDGSTTSPNMSRGTDLPSSFYRGSTPDRHPSAQSPRAGPRSQRLGRSRGPVRPALLPRRRALRAAASQQSPILTGALGAGQGRRL